MHAMMKNPSTLDRAQWQENQRAEAAYWSEWLRQAMTGANKEFADDYRWRTGPVCDVREKDMFVPFLRPVCPPGSKVRILDVGAGPLTWFPRKWFTRDFQVTAVDPLADEFDKMFATMGTFPQVHTIKGEAEKLLEQFEPESFDMVFCRNALEQFYDPVEAMRQMLAVVKQKCAVVLIQEGYRSDEEKSRGPWTIDEDNADVFMDTPEGKLDLGLIFADVATLRTYKSWHWPWVLAGFRKEPI